MGAEKKWVFTLFSAAFISLLIFISTISGFSSSYYLPFTSHKPYTSGVRRGPGHPPAFAYYISGGHGDVERMFRLLLAVYHPRNRYLLHISADGGDKEREKLAEVVKSVPAVKAFGNVDVVGKPDPVTYMGSSNIAAILRAASILLKIDGGWDWFITLSAKDYPLITQDDLSHVFSSVERDLNFIDHTSKLGFKEDQRMKPIVVDPGLYLARKRQFRKDDPVLDVVDEKILQRDHNRVTPGAWCKGRSRWLMDPCSQWGDVNVLRPSQHFKKFQESMNKLLDRESQSNQCR